jgi:hypothetical protein
LPIEYEKIVKRSERVKNILLVLNGVEFRVYDVSVTVDPEGGYVAVFNGINLRDGTHMKRNAVVPKELCDAIMKYIEQNDPRFVFIIGITGSRVSWDTIKGDVKEQADAEDKFDSYVV